MPAVIRKLVDLRNFPAPPTGMDPDVARQKLDGLRMALARKAQEPRPKEGCWVEEADNPNQYYCCGYEDSCPDDGGCDSGWYCSNPADVNSCEPVDCGCFAGGWRSDK